MNKLPEPLDKPVFKDETFAQAGVSFPLKSYTQLMDQLAELNGQQVKALCETNHLPWHPAMPRKEVDFALGSVLQRHWFQSKGSVPDKFAQCEITYTERYREMIDKLNKGELTVSKKGTTTKPKAEKKPKEPRKVLTYSIDAAKARSFEEGGYVKAGENGNKQMFESHAGYIVRILLEEKKLQFAELLKAFAKATGEGITKRSTTDAVYSNCRKLRDAKIIEVSKEPLVAAK